MSRVLGLQSRLADVVGKPLRTKVDRTQMRGDPEVCMHIYIYVFTRVYIHVGLCLYTCLHMCLVFCV